ncbi:MAG: hypothetical protein KKC46_14670 [Proteobacteria bacterium]|nr:hypothetical protein [Pseudomonadota bacterium]
MKNLDSVSKIISILSGFDKYYLYCVDPGAYNCMRYIYDALIQTNVEVSWIAEGWCKSNIMEKEETIQWHEFEQMMSCLPSRANICLLLGSQNCFKKTHHAIGFCNLHNITNFFLLDHWLNYAEHFFDFETKTSFLPTKIGVMDETSRDGIEDSLVTTPSGQRPEIYIVGHPKMEASVKTIQNISLYEIGSYRKMIGAKNKKLYLFLLEPVYKDFALNEVGEPLLGYTEYTILKYFFSNYSVLNTKVIIKPHPRQDIDELLQFLETNISQSLYDYTVDMEHDLEFLISIADEVVGMTTVALIFALKAGKKIRSIQVGRNEYARQLSNKYFENNLTV